MNEAMGELNFREVIELIEEAFFLFSDEGRLLDLNQSACRLLDEAPDSLQGTTWLLPAEEFEPFLQRHFNQAACAAQVIK